MLLALVALDHGEGHHLFNKGVAHVGQSGVPVKAGLVFHLHDAVLDQLDLVLVQLQPLYNIRVVLNELRRAEPGGYAQLVGVVLDQVDHRVDAAVDRGAIGAEVRDPGQGLFPGGGDGLVDEFRDALALGCADGHHGNTQGLAHFLHIHRAAVGVYLVHHVQGQHHGHLQLQKL